MADVRVLYFHQAEILPYMQDTAEWMRDLELDGWKVVHIITRKDHNDMGKGIEENWNRGPDLVIVGQDNVIEPDNRYQWGQLLACRHPACAIPCLMYKASTALEGVYQNQISHGKLHDAGSAAEFVEGDWSKNDPWFIGTGISKFTADAQARTAKYISADTCYFGRLDTGISQALDRAGIKRGHLHYPIHRHNKTEMENRHWK